MKEKASNTLEWIFLIVGLAMFLYHMVSTQYLILGAYEHQNIHLFFLLILTFLNTMRKKKAPWARVLQGIFVLLSVASTLYVLVRMSHLEEVIGFPEPLDLVTGVLLIVLVVEGTRQAWGMVLPIVCGIFIAYFFFGHFIPGALYHRPFQFDFIISYLSIGLSGIYGTFLSISANQVFLFVVFGAMLEVIKINDFFYEAGKLAGRLLKGGPAQTAVISSGLVGMVTGAAVANVAITGAFTIPFMKRVGYKPEIAGAIEATASTGGQLMPPVMGASAFLMAFFLGIPYAEVMIAAILPSLFYYLSVALGVQLIAVSYNIDPPKEAVDKRLIYRRLPLFLIPLIILVVLLLLRYTPMRAAFWAILTSVFLSLLSKDTKPRPAELARCLSRGAYMGAQIGVSLAVVGIMAQTLITTGLGTKIVGIVEALSGGNGLIALIVTMFVSLILGCGVPTTAAYSLVAIVVIPSLVKMGVSDLSAHFFAFYFAIISALTPPVALAALAGAGIAGANYWKTGLSAFKLAISGFIIPYLIIYNPVLVLRPASVEWAIGSLIGIPIGLASLTAFIYNCGLVRFSRSERLMSLLASMGILGYCVFRHIEELPLEYPLLVFGCLMFVLLLVRQIHKCPSRIASVT
ncbi:MAG: TRAP transporter fused permease subunit [Thermodesulfobacteriota bacterium]